MSQPMLGQYLAPALTDEEKTFLYEQRESEHYRVFLKTINYLLTIEFAKLSLAKPEELLRHQGVLIGLQIARNLMHQGKITQELKTLRSRV